MNLKIMDYETKTEEKYLTILMPFIPGKDINDKNENNSENDSLNRDILMDNINNEKLVNIRDTTNKIIENINAKIITSNSNNSKSSKKVSFYIDDKEEANSVNEDNNKINKMNNNINSVNINININKNININNNFNSSSLSSFISNIKY